MRWSVLLASLFGAALFAAASPSAALADKKTVMTSRARPQHSSTSMPTTWHRIS